MEKNSNEILFETTLTWFDYLLSFLSLIFGAIGLFYFAIKMTKSEWGGQLFICVFFLIWIIQGVRGAKTFHLLEDKLIVRRPLTFTTNTDITFNIADLKEVIFRNIKGRFGGPHIIIKSKRINESYRIDFNKEKLNELNLTLSELGIKVSLENMD